MHRKIRKIYKKGYIDPGTAVMAVGSIGPMIAAIIAAIGGFFTIIFIKPIKSVFAKIFKKK